MQVKFIWGTYVLEMLTEWHGNLKKKIEKWVEKIEKHVDAQLSIYCSNAPLWASKLFVKGNFEVFVELYGKF